jgi:hypothetical protein
MQPKSAVLCCAFAALLLQSAAAIAQSRANPSDPAATVPAIRYSSAFTGYRPLGDEKTAPWRESNDEVARTGGHIGILRNQPPGAPSAATGGHAGHHPGAAK